jgi:large subunit ribosomal protein L9
MKVILNADVEDVGRKGDVVEVAAGYARNFLLPRKLALNATKGALLQAEQMQRARKEREERERTAAEQLAEKIKSASLRIEARAGEEGQLFGSITTSDIAEALSRQIGEEIDRRKIRIGEPVRSIGIHEFSVELHSDVEVSGLVEVVRAAI